MTAVSNMKTTRIKQKLAKALPGRVASTTQIVNYLNNTMKHGTTMQQMGNVLSKHGEVVSLGKSMKAGVRYGAYREQLWGWKTDFPNGVRTDFEGRPIIPDDIIQGLEDLHKPSRIKVLGDAYDGR